ncbi:MAG TPA: alpha/beta hydrolase [Pyrinomonadaceae bacterium]
MVPQDRLLRLYPIAAIILLIHCVGAITQAQNRIDPAQVSIVYRVPKMEQVTVHRGIVFDNMAGKPLALDAYIPHRAGKGERLPSIVFVSGAEYVRQWRWFITWGQLAAAHGIVGIVPDKRYQRGLDGIRTGFEDTEKLLTYLRTNSDRLGIDPQRICLWTFSAGGRLTSMGLNPGAPTVRCLVSFYGVLDLSQEFAAIGDERERDSLLKRYSPLHVLESTVNSGGKVPPILIGRAGKDTPFINSGIDKFAATALRSNVTLTVMNYPEGDHGFDALNDTPQSRAIIKAALQFIIDKALE